MMLVTASRFAQKATQNSTMFTAGRFSKFAQGSQMQMSQMGNRFFGGLTRSTPKNMMADSTASQASGQQSAKQAGQKLPFGHPDATGLRSPLGFMMFAFPCGVMLFNLRAPFMFTQAKEMVSDNKRVNAVLDEQYGTQDTPERRMAFKRMNSTIVSKHTMGPVVEMRAAMAESPGTFAEVASQGNLAMLGHKGGERHVRGEESKNMAWQGKNSEKKKSISRQTSYNPNARAFMEKKSSMNKNRMGDYARTKSNLEGVINSAEM